MEKDLNKQLDLIKRGTVNIIQLDALKKKLERAIKTNKPLIIKAGFDPTAPDIHLGHTVLLRKLRHFQQLGHKVIFLIGDATAMVGDPTGKNASRKVLTTEEVDANAKTYEKQVAKILDVGDHATFERKHNRTWFSEDNFGFEEFVELAQRYTIARLLEREDFQNRLKDNKPISFLETFYPLMQGYDSVMLKADVELGGTDQTFNMLVGRDLQPSYGQEPQIVLTMPILEGLDGVNKMSKSLGNYVGINEHPKDIFGKIMSVSDDLMLKYYELLTDNNVSNIKSEIASGKLHPKDAKKNLAKIIVSQYHSQEEANSQAEEFDRAFKDKGFPNDIALQEISIASDKAPVLAVLVDSIKLLPSRGEAKRKIQEGALEINGQKVSDVNLELPSGIEHKIRIGKKFARVLLKKI
jgi:tyrosyl-tRNA synthetase